MAIHIENQRPALSGETAIPSDESKSGRESTLFRSFGTSIKPLEVTFFVSQLSLMLEIGTPLTKSLWALSEQIANQAFRDVIQSMARDIEEGRIDKDNNPLKHEPHTVEDLVGEWDRPYSREQACFPPGAFRVDKYWPPVNRVDNVHGDRHLICSCPPVENYAEAAE